MQPSSLHFFPLALPFMLAMLFLVGFWFFSVEIGILRYAYEKMRVDRRYVSSLLLLSLLGSYVNIPVAELPAEPIIRDREALFFGVRHIIPVIEGASRTVLAVNLGGAVIPTLLSLYLVTKHGLHARALVGVAVVAVLMHAMARPIRGVGIALPIFLPAFVAVGVTFLLSPRSAAPALAYVSGSLGTLIGADLMNLDKISGLGAPVASIGGAGTFDGIFLTGILAVLLA